MTWRPTMTPRLDAIIAELERAALVTVTEADGQAIVSLTAGGEQLARQMAMSGDEDGPSGS